MTFEYWFRIAVALETIVFPGDFLEIGQNGIASALAHMANIVTKLLPSSDRGAIYRLRAPRRRTMSSAPMDKSEREAGSGTSIATP